MSPVDLRLYVIAAALKPALTLARVAGLELDDLQELVADGYFRELQQRGLSWENIARRLGKSRRTIGSIARRSSLRPLDSSRAIERMRGAVAAVARSRELSEVDLAAVLRVDVDEVRAVVSSLVEEGVLDRRDDVLVVAAPMLDLVSEDAEHRLDSLRHFFDAITSAVHARFFGGRGGPEAFARVLTFSARKTDLGRLRDAVYGDLERAIVAEDAAATNEADAVQASFALCLAEVPKR